MRPDGTRALLADLAQVVRDLAERVEALEKSANETTRRAEIVATASRAWRVQALAPHRDQLVLASDGGDLATLPVAVARAMTRTAGALDLELRAKGEAVELIDVAGAVVATLPRAAYLALPKALAAWASANPTTSRDSLSQSPRVAPATPAAQAAGEPRLGAASRAVAAPRLTARAGGAGRARVARDGDKGATRSTGGAS